MNDFAVLVGNILMDDTVPLLSVTIFNLLFIYFDFSICYCLTVFLILKYSVISKNVRNLNTLLLQKPGQKQLSSSSKAHFA